ncbi:FliM/FliN family flagellar motor C-terminal domain-containing protein [Shimia abyssi]|nr:FliM/FliN family flagellar motor C-terminal domain-containing protein [Shimia abyssi]
MSDTGQGSILRRKASDWRQDYMARTMPPEKALRLAIEKAGETGLGMVLDVREVRRRVVQHENLSQNLNAEALLAVLEGDDGEPSALSVDAQVLAGMVEFQTIGKVVAREATGRLPTRVDAALITPFINDLLSRFRAALLDQPDTPDWLQTYRMGAMTAGPRTLSLSLTSHEYHLFELHIALEGGAKSGVMLFGFPECKVAPEEAADGRSVEADPKAFADNLKLATSDLKAILARVNVPITTLQTLAVGDVLHIPKGALHDTRLETASGHEIARAQVGQVDGTRAIRLRGKGLPKARVTEEEPNFVEETLTVSSEQELEELLAAETALDAVLPPVEEMDDPTGLADDDFSDLDDLIQLSADDIGDPTALANLGAPPSEEAPPNSVALGDGA